MRVLAIVLPAFLAGCASSGTDPDAMRTANTRAVEQRRMDAVLSGAWEPASQRGEEIVSASPKEFNMAAARVGASRAVTGKPANANEFHFVDRVRTRDFHTRNYVSKKAWMGDMKFGTKVAPTKESWLSRLTSRTKTYDTKESRHAHKEHGTRALPGGDRPFLVQGRRQADLEKNGAAQIPYGTTDLGPSWSGELKPLTIDDVKGLLNKN